ncbi:FFLEELY motif protein [Microvirga sp. M2]|uniref:FFLEELY motif protein n=1 Tax=Microvirga sp. M2 TaxID=3073270 RepID=UPI0039C09FFB
MGDHEALADRLEGQLAKAAALRARSRADPKLAATRERLREWQAGRLARTHADLLESPRFGPSASFFLSDVYAAKDVGSRDDQIGRIIPTMLKLVPAGGLEVVADALELDALSEDLDTAMAEVLRGSSTRLTAPAYGQAYRKVGRRSDRERQIDLVQHLGQALDHLTRKRFIGSALAVMRRPAKLAGFEDLQSFLERGYVAFRELGNADDFLEIVTSRERQLLDALFACDDSLLDAVMSQPLAQ